MADRQPQRLDERIGPARYPGQAPIADYFHSNFYITTSGNFRTQSLVDAMLEIGSDRILFSADWPFENIDHAANWFDNASISETDRIKIGRGNADTLFNLNLGNGGLADPGRPTFTIADPVSQIHV